MQQEPRLNSCSRTCRPSRPFGRLPTRSASDSPKIDVLINNAAGIFAERSLTVDGLERTFATNHLGPFLLTNLVLDLVRAGPGGRIVNVAAESFLSKLDFDNLEGEKSYGFLSAQLLQNGRRGSRLVALTTALTVTSRSPAS
ncbi:MAG: SDR family NAD(P)-dependent oxidoreductase, partial [Bradyrhizobium sp.]